MAYDPSLEDILDIAVDLHLHDEEDLAEHDARGFGPQRPFPEASSLAALNESVERLVALGDIPDVLEVLEAWTAGVSTPRDGTATKAFRELKEASDNETIQLIDGTVDDGKDEGFDAESWQMLGCGAAAAAPGVPQLYFLDSWPSAGSELACRCLLCAPSKFHCLASNPWQPVARPDGSPSARRMADMRASLETFLIPEAGACVIGQCPQNDVVDDDPDAGFGTAIILLQPPFQTVDIIVDKMGIHLKTKGPRLDIFPNEMPTSGRWTPAAQPDLIVFPLSSIEAFRVVTDLAAAVSPDSAAEVYDDDDDDDAFDYRLFVGSNCQSPHIINVHVREPAPWQTSAVPLHRAGRKCPRRRFLLALSMPSAEVCRQVGQGLQAFLKVNASSNPRGDPGQPAGSASEGVLELGLSDVGESFWHVPSMELLVKATRGVGEFLSDLDIQTVARTESVSSTFEA
mmetsp:Transcript_4839/g.10498  ORF Transcript_4839/g.10498 Transcript_4839/m.10498 type:complete len:457 (+) Transcript_4839:96-1466(+)